MPLRLLLAVLDQGVVHRLEQGQQPLQALGQRALRQVQPLGAQVLQQPVGRAVEQKLVQQDGHPDGDAQDALRDHFGGRRCGDDAGMSATGATGAIAPSAVDPPMGTDFDLQDGGVVGAGERDERLSAAGTPLLFGGQFDDLFHGGQVGVVPAFRSWLSPSLSARSRRSGRSVGSVDGGRSLGLAPEELLFEEADPGVELLVLLIEEWLAWDGPLMHGLPVGSLTPGLELLGQAWADRARPLGNGGSRTGRGLIVPSREGDRRGVRPGSRRMLNRHAARCKRRRAGKPESRMGLPNLYRLTSWPDTIALCATSYLRGMTQSPSGLEDRTGGAARWTTCLASAA